MPICDCQFKNELTWLVRRALDPAELALLHGPWGLEMLDWQQGNERMASAHPFRLGVHLVELSLWLWAPGDLVPAALAALGAEATPVAAPARQRLAVTRDLSDRVQRLVYQHGPIEPQDLHAFAHQISHFDGVAGTWAALARALARAPAETLDTAALVAWRQGYDGHAAGTQAPAAQRDRAVAVLEAQAQFASALNSHWRSLLIGPLKGHGYAFHRHGGREYIRDPPGADDR